MRNRIRPILVFAFLAVPAALFAGFLGVGGLEPVTSQTAPNAGLAEGEKGARIGQVVPDSPAEKAGLAAGDILVGVDETDGSDMERLIRAIGRIPVGKEVTVRYLRGGRRFERAVVLATSPAPADRLKGGIEGRKAPGWSASEWRNLPEGKRSLDLSDYAGKIVYLYFFQSW